MKSMRRRHPQHGTDGHSFGGAIGMTPVQAVRAQYRRVIAEGTDPALRPAPVRHFTPDEVAALNEQLRKGRP